MISSHYCRVQLRCSKRPVWIYICMRTLFRSGSSFRPDHIPQLLSAGLIQSSLNQHHLTSEIPFPTFINNMKVSAAATTTLLAGLVAITLPVLALPPGRSILPKQDTELTRRQENAPEACWPRCAIGQKCMGIWPLMLCQPDPEYQPK